MIVATALAILCATPVAKADVQIAGLTDLNLGAWPGTGDLSGDIGHCVLNTLNPGKYSITASGDGTSGAFALINGASSIPMSITYSDGSGWVTMSPNTPVGSQKAMNSSTFTKCLGGSGQYLIRVLVLGTDLSAAGGGTYSGTIYLTVVPQ